MCELGIYLGGLQKAAGCPAELGINSFYAEIPSGDSAKLSKVVCFVLVSDN